MGELCCEPTFQIPDHKQWCYEISYIVSGDGCFYENGSKTEVTTGDLIITPKNRLHSIIASNCQPLYFAYLGFDFNLSQVDLENENLVAFYNEPHKIKA